MPTLDLQDECMSAICQWIVLLIDKYKKNTNIYFPNFMGFMGCKCLPWSIPSPCTILNQIFRKSGLLCMQAAIPPALRRRAVPRFFFTTHIYVFESYKTIFTWIYGSKNQTRILTFLGRPAPPSFKPFHFWRNTRDFEIPGKLWIHGHVNIYIYI